ncbi:hypothetical protein Ami103574_08155 [Aminipila butyrica]|uniref:Uncharacterized protein n=1 Tax=Aminipila butyrica TaxID=433296 RepID=A0A858BUN7_9FIRM|nr:hypothetical protein [Aminipila butyrica]QIB69297.1 hypothetical protein Ami103574_08155 [Aminipila butyrica]
MQNYLNNNISLIKEYQLLYKDGINIKNLVNKLETEELVTHEGFDYGRFRVFIDSCLLLLNKEKLDHYCKGYCDYQELFQEIFNDEELLDYIAFVKNERISSEIDGEYLYYSLDGKKKTPWDQVATIRHAMAHMNIGHFMSQERGLLIYYNLYNKHKGIRKDWGIVFEPILHKFIKMFFSNYSYGILFKSTFFSKYSFEKGRMGNEFNFYEITCNKINNAYHFHLMSELAHIYNDFEKLCAFIMEHKDKLNIKEVPIKDKVDLSIYNKLVSKFKLSCKEEYFYGLKTLLDFETELSNFLVHIGHFNDVLYQYSIIKNCGNFTNSEVEMYKKQLKEVILELKEDENAKLMFELGFTYLMTVNFALRTEDDDCKNMKYADVNVSMFIYDRDNLNKYVIDNNVYESPLQHYVIERMRNALMHGHIDVLIGENGEVIFIFSDNYNKRKEKIEITLDNLKSFLSQECLYNGVPKETLILLAEPIEGRKN